MDKLDKNNKLTKTILYNLNPADNELFATMTGNFNDGSVAGKIQWGSAWWFLDQKDGMVKQLNALSNMSLLSRFVGMITDSRSFLSYPRHELMANATKANRIRVRSLFFIRNNLLNNGFKPSIILQIYI